MAKTYPNYFKRDDPTIESERVIAKLSFTGWRNRANYVEWCYLEPLDAAFKELRRNMFILYMQGQSKIHFLVF